MVTPDERRRLIREFPRLANEDFEIICPPSVTYNCIAYAAGDTTDWWSYRPEYYWPPDVERSPTIDGLRALFVKRGYRKCNGPKLEPLYEKVALYAEFGAWTHAALQMSNGRWRSKLDVGELIEHRSPDSLVGGRYGRPQVYMRRRKQT